MNQRTIQPATRGCSGCGPGHRLQAAPWSGSRPFAPARAPIQRAAPPARGHSLAALRVAPPGGVATGFAPIQLGKKSPAEELTRLQALGIVKLVDRNKPAVLKASPKRIAKYHLAHPYQGRNYHVRRDADGRVVKIAGPLQYTTTKRQATKKTAYKRKNDVNFHLLGHFAGGPSDLKENYVAVNKLINSGGGHWGRLESYVRRRLRQKNTRAYGSVEPGYTGKKKRPDDVYATFKFSTSPYEVQFQVPTL